MDGVNQVNHYDSSDTSGFTQNHQGSSKLALDSTVSQRPPKHDGALQRLSHILGQTLHLENVADLKEVLRSIGTDCQRSLPTIPINDLRGEEASAYHREDCVLRRSLAALYRLIDIRGWTHSIYNHISARCKANPNHFLINPFGLLYHEIQASSLIKIDGNGNVIDQGSSVLGVNKAGWTLHSALHSARKDVNCIIHIHLPDVIAVSCLRAGLLPVSPEANELIMESGVRYHDYRGILVDESERASIQNDLGPKAKILFLRNHGVAVAAATIPEAWYLVKRVVAACQTQVRMMQLSGGTQLLDQLKESPTHPTNCDDEDEQKTSEDQAKPNSSLLNGKTLSEGGDLAWTPEELEFEAEMRVLDSAGFRTGHIYRQPNLLRRVHLGSTWAGDTLGDQMTGAELITTDFSATDFSAAEDIATAEAAGAHQVAKIFEHVKASRQKNTQRNQWLTKSGEPTKNGLVTSSMIASPSTSSRQDIFNFHNKPHPFESPESPVSTPVKRSGSASASAPCGPNVLSGEVQGSPVKPSGQSLRSGVSVDMADSLCNSFVFQKEEPFPLDKPDTSVNKSATLPANVQHLVSKSNAPQTADGSALSADDQKSKTLDKKVKKKGSFRMPSFSRKKKH